MVWKKIEIPNEKYNKKWGNKPRVILETIKLLTKKAQMPKGDDPDDQGLQFIYYYLKLEQFFTKKYLNREQSKGYNNIKYRRNH